MAYEPRKWDKKTWGKGQSYVEDSLNHIEQGVSEGGGGGGITIDKEIADTAHPVENSAIYRKFLTKADIAELDNYLTKQTVATQGLSLPQLIIAGTKFYKDENGFLTFDAPALYDGEHSQLLNYEALEAAIQKLVGDAPETLDTIEKLAEALKSTEGGVDRVIAAINVAMTTKVDRGDLATVSYTANYNDLVNRPTIPSATTPVSYWADDGTYLKPSDPVFADLATKQYVDSKVVSTFKYKGAVETYEDLPATANDNDFYLVRQPHGEHPANMTYIWTNAQWNPFLPLGTEGAKTSIIHVESLPVTDIELDKLYQVTTPVNNVTPYLYYWGDLIEKETQYEEEGIEISTTVVTDWSSVSVQPVMVWDEDIYKTYLNFYVKDGQIFYFTEESTTAEPIRFYENHPAMCGGVHLTEENFVEKFRQTYDMLLLSGMDTLTSEKRHIMTWHCTINEHDATIKYYIRKAFPNEDDPVDYCGIAVSAEYEGCTEEEIEGLEDIYTHDLETGDPDGTAIEYGEIVFAGIEFDKEAIFESEEFEIDSVELNGSIDFWGDVEEWLIYRGEVDGKEDIVAGKMYTANQEVEVQNISVVEDLPDHTLVGHYQPWNSTDLRPIYKYDLGIFTDDDDESVSLPCYMLANDYLTVGGVNNLPKYLVLYKSSLGRQVCELLGTVYILAYDNETEQYYLHDAENNRLDLYSFYTANDTVIVFNCQINYWSSGGGTTTKCIAFPADSLEKIVYIDGLSATSRYIKVNGIYQYETVGLGIGLHASGGNIYVYYATPNEGEVIQTSPRVVKPTKFDPFNSQYGWYKCYKVGDYYVTNNFSNFEAFYSIIETRLIPQNWYILDDRIVLGDKNTYIANVLTLDTKDFNSRGWVSYERAPIGNNRYAKRVDYDTFYEYKYDPETRRSKYGTLFVEADNLLYGSFNYLLPMWFKLENMDHNDLFMYSENKWQKILNKEDIDKASTSFITTENFKEMLKKNSTFIYVDSESELPYTADADDTKIYIVYSWSGSKYYHFNKRYDKYDSFGSVITIPDQYTTLEQYFNAGNLRDRNKLYRLMSVNYELYWDSNEYNKPVYSYWDGTDLGMQGITDINGNFYPADIQVSQLNGVNPSVTVDPIKYENTAIHLVLTDSYYGNTDTWTHPWADRLHLWVKVRGQWGSETWTPIAAGEYIPIYNGSTKIDGPKFGGFVTSIPSEAYQRNTGVFYIHTGQFRISKTAELWYLTDYNQQGQEKICPKSEVATADNLFIDCSKYINSDLPSTYTDIRFDKTKMYFYNKSDTIPTTPDSNWTEIPKSGVSYRGRLSSWVTTGRTYDDTGWFGAIQQVYTATEAKANDTYPANATWQSLVNWEQHYTPWNYEQCIVSINTMESNGMYNRYGLTYNTEEGKILFNYLEPTVKGVTYQFEPFDSCVLTRDNALAIDIAWYERHCNELPYDSTGAGLGEGLRIAEVKYNGVNHVLSLFRRNWDCSYISRGETYYVKSGLITIREKYEDGTLGPVQYPYTRSGSGMLEMSSACNEQFAGIPFSFNDLVSPTSGKHADPIQITPLVSGVLKLTQHKVLEKDMLLPLHSAEGEYSTRAWWAADYGLTSLTIELDDIISNQEKLFTEETTNETWTFLRFKHPLYTSGYIYVISPATSVDELMTHGSEPYQWQQYYGDKISTITTSFNDDDIYLTTGWLMAPSYTEEQTRQATLAASRTFVRKTFYMNLPQYFANRTNRLKIWGRHVVVRNLHNNGLIPSYPLVDHYQKGILQKGSRTQLEYYCCRSCNHNGLYSIRNLRWAGIDVANAQSQLSSDSKYLSISTDGVIKFDDSKFVTTETRQSIHDISIIAKEWYGSEATYQFIVRFRVPMNKSIPLASKQDIINLDSSIMNIQATLSHYIGSSGNYETVPCYIESAYKTSDNILYLTMYDYINKTSVSTGLDIDGSRFISFTDNIRG